MNQEAYVLITVLTAVLSLVVLGFTLVDMLRIRRQHLHARWLLEEAMESMSKAEAAKKNMNEWQILSDLMLRQRSRVDKMP